jgi:hypothetical protein
VRYESLVTGFNVLPEMAGSEVLLRIHPFLSFRDPRHPRVIAFQELETSVRVAPGEWLELAGTMAVRDEVSLEILGAAGDTGEGRATIRVRVDPQGE